MTESEEEAREAAALGMWWEVGTEKGAGRLDGHVGCTGTGLEEGRRYGLLVVTGDMYLGGRGARAHGDPVGHGGPVLLLVPWASAQALSAERLVASNLGGRAGCPPNPMTRGPQSPGSRRRVGHQQGPSRGFPQSRSVGHLPFSLVSSVSLLYM